MPAAARRLVRLVVPRAARRALRRRALDVAAHLPERRPQRDGPPRVGLVGFYQWGNYGDELFLEVFREHLGQQFDLGTVFDSLDPPYVTAPIRDIVGDFDAIVIGGGDLVSPVRPRRHYWATEFLRRPVFVTGVGVPTWQGGDPAVEATLRPWFQHKSIQSITTRDIESRRWIEQHLSPRAPVASGADLVCALTLPSVERGDDPPVLGVVVRRRHAADDLGNIRRLCARGHELGYRVRGIVLAVGAARAGDLEVMNELGLPERDIVVSDDLYALTRAIGECSVLASMKFHGTVVAAMYGIPTIALIRTDKNVNFLRRIGRPDLISGLDDPELPDHLSATMTPISADTRSELRADATAMLAELRDRIAVLTAGRSRR